MLTQLLVASLLVGGVSTVLVAGSSSAQSATVAAPATFYLHRDASMDANEPTSPSPDRVVFSSLVPSARRFESPPVEAGGNLTLPAELTLVLRAQGSFRGQMTAVVDVDGTPVANVTSAPLVVGATATTIGVTFAELAGVLNPGQRLGLTLDVTPSAPPNAATVAVEMLYDSSDSPSALSVTMARGVPPATPPPTTGGLPSDAPPPAASLAEADSTLFASGIASAGIAILAILGVAWRP